MMGTVKDWMLKDLLIPVSHDFIRLCRTKIDKIKLTKWKWTKNEDNLQTEYNLKSEDDTKLMTILKFETAPEMKLTPKKHNLKRENQLKMKIMPKTK